MYSVMIYQTLVVLSTAFTHANIALPKKIDAAISWILVSPNMHKVHHHYVRPQTDSNYGNIFSIWDRLFGTFDATPMENLRYGLDVLDDSTDQSIAYQLKVPFDKSVKTDY